MERFLGELVGDKVLVYLDVVLLFLTSNYVFVQTINQALGLLIQAKLKCKPSMFALFAETINYLLHVKKKACISPNRSNLDRI